MVGRAYGCGKGVAQNKVEAVRWWLLAVAQGYADAQHWLGFVFSTGHCVARDDAEAVR